MIQAKAVTAAVAVLALLSGCGNDKSGPNPVVATIGTMAQAGLAKVKAKKSDSPAPAAAPMSPADQRAKLAEAGQPVLLVAVAAMGRTAFLTVEDAKGDVLTWSSPDGASFSQRGGVLIQTRGLGADLMSAEAPTLAQLQSGGPYKRIYYFLGDDDQGTRRTYDCSSKVVGKEDIEVMGNTFATTHLTEVCERPLGKLQNDYWIDGTTIRQSRQWASSGIGYTEFQRIID